MKASRWTLSRKAKEKHSKYPYFAKKRLETDTTENQPPASCQSAVAVPILEDKETLWSSDGEEAVGSGITSSSSDVSGSVRQVGQLWLETQISSGEPSMRNTVATLQNEGEIMADSGKEGASGGARCDKAQPSGIQNDERAQLRQWAVEYQISHTALNSLLAILRKNYDTSLPLDARTLLLTPAKESSLIKNICGGQYYHFGLYKAVNDFLSKISDLKSLQILENLGLSMKVNCDGIPLHRSSKAQFWPILAVFSCEGMETKHSPVIVGIFYGFSKPNNIDEYLKEFIDELENLSNGFSFGNHLIPLKVACFICDAPARQFMKAITSHNGYSGCERCQQVGVYESGTVIFPDLNCVPRSDQNFILQSDSDHHKGVSPLARATFSVGLVSQFVLDPMHLVYLGVMRKLLNLWLKGPLNVRIGSHKKNCISASLVNTAEFMPSEFNRKPRSLDDLDRFKATELRSFLLYTGPVVLRNNVDVNVYKNFLLLSSAVNLLSRTDIEGSVEYARDYIHKFIEHFIHIYGRKYAVYNIHNLCHLPDDVAVHGTLDKFSAFPFENFLGFVKNLLRKPNFPLSQIVNRISERNSVCSNSVCVGDAYPLLKKSHSEGPLIDERACRQYKELYLEKYCFKVTCADHGVMINNEIGCIKNIISLKHDSTQIFVIYKTYGVTEKFYDYPVASGNLGIYIVKSLQNNLKACSYKAIQSKYVLLPLSKKSIVAFPLLHSIHPQ